jgi:signal transduction histidine kinase
VKVEERTSELKDSVAHRERLEHEILEVGARERSAIGRELHDELGQHLTATALAAQSLVQQLGDRPEAGRAKSIVRWIEEGTLKARKLARGLLLEHIEPDRLPLEIEELAVSANHGAARGRFNFSGRVAANGAECAQIFRIAQEAIGNALHHAEPKAIDVTLANDNQALCLIVEDDGRGFVRPKEAAAGYGLRIMEHRAKLIGASLSIISSPGDGTKVICRLNTSAPASP